MILCLTREMQMMVKVEVKLKRMGRTPVITQSIVLNNPKMNISIENTYSTFAKLCPSFKSSLA